MQKKYKKFALNNMSPTEKKELKEKKKEEKRIKKTIKKESPKYNKMSVDEMIPIIKRHDEYNLYYMEDGSLVAIYGIVEKNLLGAPEDDIMYDNACFDKLYKTYSDDLKIITSNFPTDTRKQIDYYNYLIEKNEGSPSENPVFIDLLKRKRSELTWIAENRQRNAWNISENPFHLI